MAYKFRLKLSFNNKINDFKLDRFFPPVAGMLIAYFVLQNDKKEVNQ